MLKVRSCKFSLLFLICTQTVGFIFVMMGLQSNKPSPMVKKPERMHILILSTWRSGSSFTGQIFSQHPDVFYLMEPAWHVWTSLPGQKVKVLKMAVRDLVRSSFLCDMSVFDAYMPGKRYKSTLFQWETSRALCSPPACKLFQRTDIISQVNCRTLCKNYPFDAIENSCKTYNHIVVKEVRFFDLQSLYPLLEDPSLNLKILHLVRDPRAVFQSRDKASSDLSPDNNIIFRGIEKNKSMYKTEDIPYKLIEEIYKSQVDIYLSAINGSHSALDSRYMMVRYEDIIQDPIEKTRQMYLFGTLNFTPKLRSWIHNITHGKGRGSKFVINPRDADKVSNAWRHILKFETVQKIQSVCSKAMETFGYKLLKSKEEQYNLTYETSLPLPEREKTSEKASIA
ncbi:carbohydrate sulfotransferase 4-like [Phyllobates terribilis]|uniref:carbohydrate sulfotransferase 4-like n=1 Tax=Phyllobates terribilis TaxID=111132 RepID=UPI003CCB07B4